MPKVPHNSVRYHQSIKVKQVLRPQQYLNEHRGLLFKDAKIINITSHYTLWCLGRQQSLSTSACPEPASSMKPQAWLSSRSQLVFSVLFSVLLSFSFRLASSEALFLMIVCGSLRKECPNHLHRRLVMIAPMSSCLPLLSRSPL